MAHIRIFSAHIFVHLFPYSLNASNCSVKTFFFLSRSLLLARFAQFFKCFLMRTNVNCTLSLFIADPKVNDEKVSNDKNIFWE
jgi:hypothetical protein